MTKIILVLVTMGGKASRCSKKAGERVGNCLCWHGRCLAAWIEEAEFVTAVDGNVHMVMDDFGTERPPGLVAWRVVSDHRPLRSALCQCSRQAGRVVHPSILSSGYRIVLFGRDGSDRLTGCGRAKFSPQQARRQCSSAVARAVGTSCTR
jgi:hypothetical protein